MADELKGYMTLAEAAEKVGLSQTGIRFWVYTGRLKTVTVGKRMMLVHEKELEEAAKEMQSGKKRSTK